MASRRRAREYALQALYQSDVARGSVPDALSGLWTGQLEGDDHDELARRQADSEEIEFTTRLARGVEEGLEDLDSRIEKVSTNWRIARMSIVDRNILRLGTFELLKCVDIPANVSINEAVELAKRFGTAESRGFVNGILDRIARDLGRVR
jgi:transcription antitermination protein NusB